MSEKGNWPEECVQRAFVEGAKWWQDHHNGSTMFGSEREEAEAEAVKRYGEPQDEESIVEVLERRMVEYSDWVNANLQNLFDKKPLLPRLEWDKPNRKILTYADRTKAGK